jgi:hypothetical protein
MTMWHLVLQILLHHLLRLGHVHRDHDQAFAGKFGREVVDQTFFALAIRTLRRPELKEDHLPFGRIVVELFAVEGLGAKAGSGLTLVVASNDFAMDVLSSGEGNCQDRSR